MAAASGTFLVFSFRAALHGSSHRYFTLLLTNTRMLDNLALESAILGLLLIYLRRCGWEPRDLRIKVGLLSTAASVPLGLGMMLANTLTVATLFLGLYAFSHYPSLLSFLIANNPHLARHSVDITWPVLITGDIVNAFFEEILCTAYMFNQFAARIGPFAALLLTDIIRMGYHTYQGPVHMLGIGAVFLVLNGYYWWSRNLWTVILAHAVLDFISLGLVKVLLS